MKLRTPGRAEACHEKGGTSRSNRSKTKPTSTFARMLLSQCEKQDRACHQNLKKKRQKAGSPRSRFDFTVWIQLQDSWLDVSTTHSRNPQISTVLVSAPAGTHSTAHYLALGEMQISYNLSTREGGEGQMAFRTSSVVSRCQTAVIWNPGARGAGSQLHRVFRRP